MEVHPPDHPIRNVRDFLLHLLTITVGLLIALGLEGLVEKVHNRHLLHTAEADLRVEIRENRKSLAEDEQHLNLTEQHIEAALDILDAVRAHKSNGGDITPHWEWDDVQSTAWDTAHNTGAIALMPYDSAQAYALIYGQQEAVNAEATLYIRDIYRITAPLHGSRSLADVPADEIDAMIANSQQALADLRLLRDLSLSLDRIYERSGSEL